MSPDTWYVKASALREFAAAIFVGLGLPPPDAVIVADCLVQANLRGLDKDSNPAEGFDEVLMPGEPELRREAEQLLTGLPLSSKVLASLQTEADDLGVPLPAFSPTPLVAGE